MGVIGTEHTLTVLLSVLSLGLIIPELFRNRRFPFATLLILFGALLGPYGFGLVKTNETLEFFGLLGSLFLMFMAGLEIKMDALRDLGKGILVMALSNSIFPMIIGVAITRAFGYSWLVSAIIGTLFMSSSVAIVSISLESAGLIRTKIGQSIISATVLQDTLSLLVLSMVFRGASHTSLFSMGNHLIFLIIAIAVMKYSLPRASSFILKHLRHIQEYEEDLKLSLIVLLTVSLLFSLIGVHPIVAAFLVGVLLSDILESEKTYNKLHTLGYGLFIPIFFFAVGMKMDLSLIPTLFQGNPLALAIIGGLIASKVLSGYLSAKATGFQNKESAIFGFSSIVQLTTTLAVVYSAEPMGMIDSALTTSIILLSIITTFVSPLLLNLVEKDTSL